MFLIGIFFIFIGIIALIYSNYKIKNVHIYNEEIDKQNARLREQENELLAKISKLQLESKQLEFNNNLLSKEEDKIKVKVQKEIDNLSTIQNKIQITLENQKEISQNAFENYCDILSQLYKDKDEEFTIFTENLRKAYAAEQERLIKQSDEIKLELESLKATRDATFAAALKEKEIKEKLAFYCLAPKDMELKDIETLDRIKKDLHNPRILSMLIWSTYFQKPMTALCNNILGTNTVCGIYKITNQKNDLCYIGQSVDIATRWKSHAKCGLGIDTPAGNKLYKAMQDYGIWNFSWELLEECTRDQLDAKEKYYIELYQAYQYGYNSNAGNK